MAGVKVRVRIVEFEAEGPHDAVTAALGEFAAALASSYSLAAKDAHSAPARARRARRKGD
jgi:hypothetical protein